MIDSYFTLKIAGSGLHHFYTSLHPERRLTDVLPRFMCLWIAPEILHRNTKALTPTVDIYSLGVIMYEIMTRNTPFGVDPNNQTALEGKHWRFGPSWKTVRILCLFR